MVELIFDREHGELWSAGWEKAVNMQSASMKE
jgi:hypothetical protein